MRNHATLVLPSVLFLLLAPATRAEEIPVSEEELKKTVSFLTEIDPPRNYKNTKSLDKAAGFISKHLKAAGLKVEEQTYEVKGKTYRNVIARTGPSDDETPRIVIGAHYDVAGSTPGADDNGSGVAGLLEVARLLKELEPKLAHPVELVAFTLEEPPFFNEPLTRFMGSYVHAKSLKDANVPVKAMICLEMIGYYTDEPVQKYPLPGMEKQYPKQGNYIAVIGNPRSAALVQAAKKTMKAVCTIDVQSLVAPPTLPMASFSDHKNYWRFGFPAVMINDTSFMRSPHYHQATDTPETLDFTRMADAVRGVYAVLVDLAGSK